MNYMTNLFDVINHFKIVGNPLSIEPYGSGHINVTYLVTTDKQRYILQKLNNNLFTEVDKLMNNIYLVTKHLSDKVTNKPVLSIVETIKDKIYLEYENGFYRVYDFIENSVCLQIPRSPKEFYESAVLFGEFASQLADFDATKLYEILPDFHNTVKRYEAFIESLEKNSHNRKNLALPEIDFALRRRGIVSKITSLIEMGKMPLKVTHNDTKLNNSLLEEGSLKGLAVIDLDTVMPGSICYDFGDSIRFGCNSSYEDEEDLSKVYFKFDMFESFVQGYLSSMKNITQIEKDHLVDGAILMTFECGIRFLTDFLNGDTYFKTTKENHNLYRCRTQFKLVQEMENNYDYLKQIINKY